MYTTVILGFGHCGKNLHLHCMQKLANTDDGSAISSMMHAVDLKLTKGEYSGLETHWEKLPDASVFSNPILHVCTPTAFHLTNVAEALEKGYRRIILEKPVAPNLSSSLQVQRLAAKYSAEILVVAVWLNSKLTERLLQLVSPAHVANIEMLQNKPRFSRSLKRESENVFDIETPHQVSLVLPFLGDQCQIESASTRDLAIAGELRVGMASGEITLKAPNGVKARLISKLDHPVRERFISFTLKSGEKITGFYPVSRDDNYSQLFRYSSQGDLIEHDIFDDDPLTRVFAKYYEYWQSDQTDGQPTGASIDFNLKVSTLINVAKNLADPNFNIVPVDLASASDNPDLRNVAPGLL